MKTTYAALLAVLLFFYYSSDCQRNKGSVLLRGGTFVPEENIRSSYIDTFNKQLPRVNNKSFGLIHFESIPSIHTREFLSRNGIELLDYIPENSYTFTVTGSLLLETLKAAGIKSISKLSPKQKMESHFASGQIPLYAIKITGTVDVWISFPKTFTSNEVMQDLKKLNIDIISTENEKYHILALRIATNRLSELASLPYVQFLQPAPPPPHSLNYDGRSLSRANTIGASVINGGKNLNGQGITVGIGDDGDVQTHVDFSGRLIDRVASGASYHGHHTTGTLAGAGNINELYRGFDAQSTIVSQYFTGILNNASIYVNDYGMVLTNNSYGNIVACDYDGTYDLYSSLLDQMAFDLPNLQNVFAAGNSGASTCAPFGTGFRTVLGGFQTAKNVLTVGATTDSGLVADFSSRGPVKDGRTKPEIVAQGQMVVSAWPYNTYATDNGTSMSSPAVTGGLALLYQEYKKLNSGINPPAGLMKAIICNGSTDAGNTGPDYLYGYGNMNLMRSTDMIENNHFQISSIINGSTNNYSISIPANTAQVKVMLYWNDPAASPLTSKALVNDLDLKVINPSSVSLLPQILDTAYSNVGNPSTIGVDHLNNMEQVVINNPSAGTYTIQVQGTAITQNPSQEYYIVYDIIPIQLKLTSPAGGEAYFPTSGSGTLRKISWDANGFTSGTGTLEFSADNGSSWSTIQSGVNINRAIYSWSVPDTVTSQAVIRLTKDITGETSSTKTFTIIGVPVIALSAVQCEGYIKTYWNKIKGATDYEVMILKGDTMTSVAFVTDTVYTFSGLSKDSSYWVTIRARLNGMPGLRAIAINRIPNSGSCSGTISDNDLKIDAIIAPISGRKFTSSQLGSSQPVSIRIKNLDDAPATNFTASYSINGGPWVNENVAATINGGSTYTYTFLTNADLSLPGNYNFVFAIHNSAPDPVTLNDTAYALIRSLDNQPLDLTSYHVDDMESAQITSYQIDTIGLYGLDRFDFANTDPNGRLRTFLNSGMAFSGSKALTLDTRIYDPSGNTNYLIGTYNLSPYNANTDNIRLDFEYNNHGQTNNISDRVWIRGDDTQPWIIAYDLDNNENSPGIYKKTNSIDISGTLNSNGQNFGTSFQVKWGQFGVLPATDMQTGNGYSFDDVRIYRVFNDLQMISIDSPAVASCALNPATSIKISVKNSAYTPLTNIPVRYRINNGSWVSDNIATINGNSQIQFTFSQKADFSATGVYNIQAIVDYSSDSFRDNDTASITIVNSPLITTFPYLENFESGNGNWYVGGLNPSWEYGTPASSKINKAASGAKAWKTRLAGNYNDLEYSYLYSPCFNLSGMTNPTLSFSAALDLENCGSTLCDGAWIEYSTDGIAWNKLGTSLTGTNWYNDSNDTLWSIQNFTYWHVATTPLPAGLTNLHLRFVLHSDPATNYEGIAIDDIHIYDNNYGIYEGPTLTSPVTLNPSSNVWTDYLNGGKLLVSLKPGNDILGSTDVQAFINTGAERYTSTQYYHDRNITVKPTNNPTSDSVSVRFYFLDSETNSLINATGCSGCSKPSSAYELGISKYDDPDKSIENGTIGDNTAGIWSFIIPDNVIKVPFDKGYYAEYKVKDFSEFWLNNGGINNNTALPIKVLDFTAQKTNGNNVLIKWSTASESNISSFEIQVARGNSDLQAGKFYSLGNVNGAGNSTSIQNYNFNDLESGKTGIRFYRLKINNIDGSFSFSPIRSILFDQAGEWQVFPNPSTGLFFLTYQLNNNEILKAKIFDAKGSLVKEYSVTGSGYMQKLIIDLSGSSFASGTYLLQVDISGNIKSYKLYKAL